MFTYQIRFAASSANSMVIMKINVQNHPVCSKCGEPAIHYETLCKNPTKCVNCGESHTANSKECKVWLKEKEKLRVKFTRNISFPEARKIVESPIPVPGSSYASVVKPTVKPV